VNCLRCGKPDADRRHPDWPADFVPQGPDDCPPGFCNGIGCNPGPSGEPGVATTAWGMKFEIDNNRTWLKSHSLRWAQHSEVIKQLPRRGSPCSNCPLFAGTRSKSVTDDMVAEIQARIAGGEHWVCHQTHDPQGELLPDSQRCALGVAETNIKHRSCASHCCQVHGCKYGYDDCPVATKQIKGMTGSCETCGLTLEGYYDGKEELIAALAQLEAADIATAEERVEWVRKYLTALAVAEVARGLFIRKTVDKVEHDPATDRIRVFVTAEVAYAVNILDVELKLE
jgi:hypothetical protein